MKFIISGYPRSRTAWLSVLLSQPGCFCFHELSATDPDLAALNLPNYTNIGTSDSGALLIAPDLPGAKYLFIERNREEVIESLSGIYDGIDADSLLDAIDRHKRGEVIQFDDLNNYDTCDYIWRYVGNKLPLNRQWYALVSKMNIQLHDYHIPVSEESYRRLRNAV